MVVSNYVDANDDANDEWWWCLRQYQTLQTDVPMEHDVQQKKPKA